jgi:hypothetical protein
MNSMDDVPILMPVPLYGEIVHDLGRSGSYIAAKRGVIPTVEVQGKLQVPWRIGLKKLAGDDQSVLEALTADFLNKLLKLQARAA